MIELPEGLSNPEAFIYRTGMIARAEVWLYHENESLFGVLQPGKKPPRFHAQLIDANRSEITTTMAPPSALAAFDSALENARTYLKKRNEVVHGAFVEGDSDPTVAVNLNAKGQDGIWRKERFDELFDQLRRAAIRVNAVRRYLDPNETRHSKGSLLYVARDEFVLYLNGSWTASRKARTEQPGE